MKTSTETAITTTTTVNLVDPPTGIRWSVAHGKVVGTVIAYDEAGVEHTIVEIKYTPEQAAQVATQLITMAGRA